MSSEIKQVKLTTQTYNNLMGHFEGDKRPIKIEDLLEKVYVCTDLESQKYFMTLLQTNYALKKMGKIIDVQNKDIIVELVFVELQVLKKDTVLNTASNETQQNKTSVKKHVLEVIKDLGLTKGTAFSATRIIKELNKKGYNFSDKKVKACLYNMYHQSSELIKKDKNVYQLA